MDNSNNKTKLIEQDHDGHREYVCNYKQICLALEVDKDLFYFAMDFQVFLSG